MAAARRRARDPCASCRWWDPSQLGTEYVELDASEGCVTGESAYASLLGTARFGAGLQPLPSNMRLGTCYRLPMGFECFASGRPDELLGNESCTSTHRLSNVSSNNASTAVDPCASCRWWDPTKRGLAFQPIRSPLFGIPKLGPGRCFTRESALAEISAKGGSLNGFGPEVLDMEPLASSMKPHRCYQLPEGSECFSRAPHGVYPASGCFAHVGAAMAPHALPAPPPADPTSSSPAPSAPSRLVAVAFTTSSTALPSRPAAHESAMSPPPQARPPFASLRTRSVTTIPAAWTVPLSLAVVCVLGCAAYLALVSYTVSRLCRHPRAPTAVAKRKPAVVHVAGFEHIMAALPSSKPNALLCCRSMQSSSDEDSEEGVEDDLDAWGHSSKHGVILRSHSMQSSSDEDTEEGIEDDLKTWGQQTLLITRAKRKQQSP